MQEYAGVVCICVTECPCECGDKDGLVNGWLKNGALPHMLMN